MSDATDDASAWLPRADVADLRRACRLGDHARCVQALPGVLDELERVRAENRVLKASALIALDEAGDG